MFSDLVLQTDAGDKHTLYDAKYLSRIPYSWKLSFEMKVAAASLMRLQETFNKMDVEMNKFDRKYKTYLYRYYNANGC